MNQYTWALVGTGIMFLATTVGASTVFFFKKPNEVFNRACMGFAAGIMVAAAFFSLLLPSIEMAEEFTPNIPPVIPAACGFALGVIFLYGLDKLIPHINMGGKNEEGVRSRLSRSTLLVSAVTLHNIPEGMAAGLAFALAATTNSVTLYGAFALAVGMALQNLPEGAAVAMPIRQDGASRKKAFLLGSLSGIVEPIGGILIVLLMDVLTPALPYFLSFAAGAMLYVVVEELIPAAQGEKHSDIAVISFMAGFIIMMVLDILLG